MGDPKKQRKKYSTPMHPWKAERIKEEKELTREYGLKNKKEIWKMNFILKKFKNQAKKLIIGEGEQEKKEEQQLKDRLNRLGLIDKKDIKTEDILALELKDIMNRRLQTLVYKKNLARTIKQARQFIIHSHIMVNDKKIDTPSYLVLKDEENKITFSSASKLKNEDHPERVKKETVKEIKEPVKTKRKVIKPLKKKTDKAEKVIKKKEKPEENDK